MATPINKLVIRGSTKISLHDRFTRLQRVEVPEPAPTPRHAAHAPAAQQTHFSRGVGYPSYSEPPSPPLYRPSSRYQSRSRDLDFDRHATMQAALKIKRRSLMQNRLGVRSSAQPYYSAPFSGRNSGSHWRSGRGGYFNRFNDRRRQYSSNVSLNSTGGGGVGGGPRFPYRRRGGYYAPRARGGGRFRGGRRGFRGGGRGRFRGRGRGGYNRGPPPKKEDLDAQLDQYMRKTKGTLDKDLDEYMQQKDADE